MWEQLTGWWTPGWGNLFTVAVAVGVITVSAYYNRRTLQRANLQFKQARLDARNDKLRAEIAAFLLALSERTTMDRVHRARLEEMNRSVDPDYRPSSKHIPSLIEETTGVVHNRLAVHSFAIRMLTNDSRITAPVLQIEQAVGQELTQVREVAGLGDKPVDPRDAVRVLLKEMFSFHSWTDLETQINGATILLKKHCLDNLPLERQRVCAVRLLPARGSRRQPIYVSEGKRRSVATRSDGAVNTQSDQTPTDRYKSSRP